MDMRIGKITPLLAGALCFVIVLSAAGDDWPQWRGPQRTGLSRETGLLKEWPKEGPKLVWQMKDIGYGFGTPAVVGDHIYVISNRGKDNEFVAALDSKDGHQLWATRIGKVGNPDQQPSYPGSRSTPTIDGDALYVLGSDGDLACLDRATGKPRWQKSFRTDFGGQPGVWAYSESPLVDGDQLICMPGGSQATVVALNKKTGDTIWKSAVAGGEQAGYSSATVVEIGGVRQYIEFLQKGLAGIDAKTGKILWRYDVTAKGSMANIPTPVFHDGRVYSATGMTGGGLALIKAQQGSFEVEPKYFAKKLPNAIGGSVKLGDYLYGATNSTLMCIDFATGAVKWDDRSLGAASVCAAEGMIYIHGENGQVALVEATPEAYHEKGRFTPMDQPERNRTNAWAYPVIANGKLYIRDLGSLWCYDLRSAK